MELFKKIEKFEIKNLICQALEEDLAGHGDITTKNLVSLESVSNAYVICKESGGAILSGIDVFFYVFEELSKEIVFEKIKNDGDFLKREDIVCRLKGPSTYLLAGERTALNFLQHMSGIATYTQKFVSIASKYNVKITDTRKTKPCLRKIEKYAVRCGGGFNHRYNLSDGILVKDNHITTAGGIKQALNSLRNKIPHQLKIEVEVKTFSELDEAIEGRADIIMLDNMSVNDMAKAVKIIRGKLGSNCIIEASGGVNLNTFENICKTGVNIISAGCITHSAPATDFSLEFE